MKKINWMRQSLNLLFFVGIFLLSACSMPDLSNLDLTGTGGGSDGNKAEKPKAIEFYTTPTVKIVLTEENGTYLSELSIEPLAQGLLEIVFPRQMDVGGDALIILNMASLSDIKSINEEDVEKQIYQEDISIYPFMRAELSGGKSIDIIPSGDDEKAITALSGEWSWFVTPHKSGTQTLILTISVPILIDGEESQYELKNIKLDFLVKDLPTPTPTFVPPLTPTPSFGSQLENDAIGTLAIVVPAIIAIITVIVGGVKYYLDKKKTKNSQNKKKRIKKTMRNR